MQDPNIRRCSLRKAGRRFRRIPRLRWLASEFWSIVPSLFNSEHGIRCPLRCLLLLSLALLAGCANRPGARYNTVPGNLVPRDSSRAQALNEDGLALLQRGSVSKAIETFREALSADMYFSSAHNNLGLALMRSQDYYEAAWEFQYAAKLSPRATAPRNNLGLLYEKLGRLDNAVEQYESALEVDPDNLAAMRYLARTHVKADRKDEELIDLLERLFDTPVDSPQWDYWVRGQLVRLGRAPEKSQ